MQRYREVITLLGPTASGKSALAMNLAQSTGGVIINADAMQMYRDLRILTARPSPEEEARVPHRLYGVLDAQEDSSVAVWLARVVPQIRALWQEGRQPILVGGTGMYIKALMQGLVEIPEIPPDIRQKARELGKEALAQYDPVMDTRLKPGDTQRRLRALEVVLTTGKSLAQWQEEQTLSPLPEAAFHLFKVERPREEVYARINQRFVEMMEQGALEEVEKLKHKLFEGTEGVQEADRAISPRSGAPSAEQGTAAKLMDRRGAQTHNYPILKAHGVPELWAHLAGEMTLEAAIAQAQQHTRNYAKRQMTWLRTQLPEAKALSKAEDILDHLPRNR